MAGKKQLPPVRVLGGKGVGAAESRLDELRAMRRVLAAHIDSENTLARDLAPLMRQAREISVEIEQLEAREAESEAVVDDSADGSSPFRLEAI